MATAVEKLQPSRLSDQKELLADDVDLSTFALIVNGRAALELAGAITSGHVSRTIDGASTLEVTVNDPFWILSKSGLFAASVDVQIDGLFFRLKGFDRQGDTVALSFEDREVALLRSYPKADAPHKGYRVWDARKKSRLDVVRQVVADVKEIRGGLSLVTLGGEAPITSASNAPDKTARDTKRKPGFFSAPVITVKNRQSTPTQRSNLDRVLQVGYSMKARRKVLVVAVMVVTQESEAKNLKLGQGDRDSVGLFQQRASQGWPATGNVEVDAAAFFAAAISDDQKNPDLGYADLAQDVQLSANGSLYAQWRTEAEHTVTAWGVPGETATDASTLAINDSSFQFMQGTQTSQNGKKTYTREDDWAFLQRLASEVTWRCFAVSGSLYFVTDSDLLRSQPRMTVTPDSPGVDAIEGSFDEGRQSIRKGHRVQRINQTCAVTCRIGRWDAPPGSVVVVDETGIFDGRWLVNTIDRPLFSKTGTVTLHRAQTALPEAQAPEYLQTGETTTYSPSEGGDVQTASVLRQSIVAAAKKAAQLRADYRYAQVRPMPSALFGGAVPKLVDCSSFFTLVYKAAKAPDPNGYGYNGSGDTGSLAANGQWTTTPQPGDAAFFGDTRTRPHHVAVYIGGGQVVNMGGPGEPIVEDVGAIAAVLPLLGYMDFLDRTPEDRHHH